MGGSARADVQSLAILRPLSVMTCTIALWTLTREHLNQNRFLFIFAGLLFGLVLLHLAPLPPALWSRLPGRSMISLLDEQAGLGAVWRPASLVPSTTRNALFSLFVPLSVLLLGAQLKGSERRLVMRVFLGLVVVSGFIGLLQAISDPNGPLYLYRYTNHGSAVGLMANRNHQAALLACAFPMIGVYACAGIERKEQERFRALVATSIGVVTVPLLLVTGSRSGSVLGLIGLMSIIALYSRPKLAKVEMRRRNHAKMPIILGALLAFGLMLLTLLFSRAQAFERLVAVDPIADLRIALWGPIVSMGLKYFPVGSGIGSFVEIYQIDEPHELLSPLYINHAHNDWLEVFLTAGLPGVLLLLVALLSWLRASVLVWTKDPNGRPDVTYARMSSVLIILLALASFTDYPTRTPSIACLLVFAALWLQAGCDTATSREVRHRK